MKVAVEGCAHGELDNIYDSIKALEDEENIKVDLLICCGDFQSVRNEQDLRCMAVPPKYYNMCTFYKYYGGEKKAPILTIFIGGNHEASNYLQELPFGGWVAPNIYYLGYGNVIDIGGIRIGGISGIYKGRDYMKGHYEMTPYSEDAKRSVYHIRNIEVFRLKQVSQPIDIFLSHDWPNDITKYGDEKQLLKFKPFFKDDIESGKLGSPPCTELLETLKPKYWFSAHLHCKFAAMVEHKDKSTTKFLALDKCLPNKRFLQILDIPHDEAKPVEISYDLEWLTVLYLTDHLFSIKNGTQYMPSGACTDERSNFKPSDEEKEFVLDKFGNDLKVPQNFKMTTNGYTPESPSKMIVKQPPPRINPQTTIFCNKLCITDPAETLIKTNGSLDLSKLSELDTSHTPIIESDSSFVSPSKSPIKRLSLHLPKPVNDVCSEEEEEEKKVSEAVEKNTSSKEGDITDEQLEVIKEEDTKEKPLVRKLKRRNAEMYENDDN